jgi:hypothetical protein
MIKQNLKKELLLDKSYSIDTTESAVKAVVLSYSDKEKFKNLNAKSKLTRLNYFKEKSSIENTIINIVSQSKYLRLYKDTLGLHLRYEEDLEEESLSVEQIILDYIHSNYSLFISEEVNSGMSGDINRLLISKGTDVYEE